MLAEDFINRHSGKMQTDKASLETKLQAATDLAEQTGVVFNCVHLTRWAISKAAGENPQPIPVHQGGSTLFGTPVVFQVCAQCAARASHVTFGGFQKRGLN